MCTNVSHSVWMHFKHYHHDFVVNDECYVLNSKFLFPVVLNILTSARMFASIDTPALTIVCSIF